MPNAADRMLDVRSPLASICHQCICGEIFHLISVSRLALQYIASNDLSIVSRAGPRGYLTNWVWVAPSTWNCALLVQHSGVLFWIWVQRSKWALRQARATLIAKMDMMNHILPNLSDHLCKLAYSILFLQYMHGRMQRKLFEQISHNLMLLALSISWAHNSPSDLVAV